MISIDLETFLITVEDLYPTPVCMSVYKSDREHYIIDSSTPDKIKEHFIFLTEKYPEEEFIFHSASYDLTCLCTHNPELFPLIFSLLLKGKIRDIYIRERLLDISTIGILKHKGYSLKDLVLKYKKEDRSIWKDSSESPRLKYKQYYGIPLDQWEQDFVAYALVDSKDTYDVFVAQNKNPRDKGIGSMNTELLQVATDFCLALSTKKGILINTIQAEKVAKPDMEKYKHIQEEIFQLGYGVKGKHNNFSLLEKNIKIYLTDTYPELISKTMLTEKERLAGKSLADKLPSLSEAALQKLPINDKLIRLLLEYLEVKKNCTTYYPYLIQNPVIHPAYKVLGAVTGRISCKSNKEYASVNIQNQPGGDDVRGCFVPRAGYIFIVGDLKAIELATSAQQQLYEFGSSVMADKINQGYDLHCYTASKFFNISYEDFNKKILAGDKDYKYMRGVGKVFNLALPGGFSSPDILIEYAKKTFDIELKEKLITHQRNLWLKTYPEASKMLAKAKELTCRGRTAGYEINGRYRNQCYYTTWANGVSMQSRAADGIKQAICNITQACYDITKNHILYGSHLFESVHDENGIETINKNIPDKMKAFGKLMVDSVKVVVPDVQVTCEVASMRQWTKNEGLFVEKLEVSSS